MRPSYTTRRTRARRSRAVLVLAALAAGALAVTHHSRGGTSSAGEREVYSNATMPAWSMFNVAAYKNNWAGQQFCPNITCSKDKVEAFLQRVPYRQEAIDLPPESMLACMRGRTLWLVGDSQMRNFFHTIACFLRNDIVGESVEEAEEKDIAAIHCLHLGRGDGSLCLARSDFAWQVAAQLKRISALVEQGRRDILVYNLGLHYSGARIPLYRQALVEAVAAKTHLESVEYIWMDTPAQHYAAQPNGEYAANTTDKSCGPIRSWQAALSGGTYNVIAKDMLGDLGSYHFSTWRSTVDAWDVHNGKGDCTHWCRPTVYELWVYLFFKTFHTMLCK